MTQNDTSDAETEPEDVSALQELLAMQAREIETLSKELAASYRKELIFFDNLEQRDRKLRRLEDKNEQLQTLRNSPGGVTQRAYWVARKRAQKAYWIARKRILKGGKA